MYGCAGRYNTPWEWTSTSSDFDVSMSTLAQAANPVHVVYQPVRPGPTEHEDVVSDMIYAATQDFRATISNSMSVVFSPESTGAYGAATSVHLDVMLPEEVSAFAGGIVELQVNMGWGWDSGVSLPHRDDIVVTIDVAEALTDALLLSTSSSLREKYHQSVLRVMGILTGKRKFRIAIGWKATWVHGESQELSGNVSIWTSLMAIRSYILQHVLATEFVAARPPSVEADWDVI